MLRGGERLLRLFPVTHLDEDEREILVGTGRLRTAVESQEPLCRPSMRSHRLVGLEKRPVTDCLVSPDIIQ